MKHSAIPSLLNAGLILCAGILCSSSVMAQQEDLSGEWTLLMHEDEAWRGPGPELGEYEGLPLNAAGRMKAWSWNASINTVPEHQCIPLPADDFTDFGNIRMVSEVDRATQGWMVWQEYSAWLAQER